MKSITYKQWYNKGITICTNTFYSKIHIHIISIKCINMLRISMSASWNLEKNNSNQMINCDFRLYGLLLENKDLKNTYYLLF